jgi:hypothetical protein
MQGSTGGLHMEGTLCVGLAEVWLRMLSVLDVFRGLFCSPYSKTSLRKWRDSGGICLKEMVRQ